MSFNPQSGFSLDNARTMAQLSSAAYLIGDPALPGELSSLGLFLVEQIIDHKDDIGWYIASCSEYHTLQFRGTEPFEVDNWIIDDRFFLTQNPHGYGRMHSGFESALSGEWSAIQTALAPILTAPAPLPIIIGGHSMGGALANAAAIWMGTGFQQVYTFGEPRGGDPLFAAGLIVPKWRVVNKGDIVPRVPPPIEYWHSGKLVFLDGRSATVGGGMPWLELLTIGDHFINEYIQTLNAIPVT